MKAKSPDDVRDERIVNILLAAWRWSEVSPRSVNLRTWGCGTHACFGGHLASWPEFQDKGVRVFDMNPDERGRGEPVMQLCGVGHEPFGKQLGPREVAYELFGNSELFDLRGCYLDYELGVSGADTFAEIWRVRPDGRPLISDHKLVSMRIARQLEMLS
jgi:hypothetical protein